MKNVWILDIETSPMVVLVFELGKQYLTTDNVVDDWHIMSFTAKRLETSETIYMETRNKNDKPLLKKLWEIFDSADVIITQNGKKFDEPRIRARMMLMGMKPYRAFKHHDTFLENTDKAFTSHSLAYLSKNINKKFKKLKHKNFPGLSLWKECLGIQIKYKPNPKAWAEMRKYNNYDVLSTEELYLNTRGWSRKTAPDIYDGDNSRLCKCCGEYRLHHRGYEKLKLISYERLQCQSCGKWCRGNRIKSEAA